MKTIEGSNSPGKGNTPRWLERLRAEGKHADAKEEGTRKHKKSTVCEELFKSAKLALPMRRRYGMPLLRYLLLNASLNQTLCFEASGKPAGTRQKYASIPRKNIITSRNTQTPDVLAPTNV